MSKVDTSLWSIVFVLSIFLTMLWALPHTNAVGFFGIDYASKTVHIQKCNTGFLLTVQTARGGGWVTEFYRDYPSTFRYSWYAPAIIRGQAQVGRASFTPAPCFFAHKFRGVGFVKIFEGTSAGVSI